jgi:heptosyltransferase-2
MLWKRDFLEAAIRISGLIAGARNQPAEPSSIFILRNGDIGDLLVVTPLFQALHNLFPQSCIAAGVGNWNLDTLKFNPYISNVIPINAPWHNKFVKDQSLFSALSYINSSPESKLLRQHRFDIGIDILGSGLGSLLLIRAGIPYRMGVRGYAGGHTAAQACVDYNPEEHVGRSALRFAELLGTKLIPEVRPQIFLSESEKLEGVALWKQFVQNTEATRIILAPGGGFPQKCWPAGNFIELAKMLNEKTNAQIIIVGGPQDITCGAQLNSACPAAVDLTGKVSLRDTFSLVAACNLVICNSSMVMHTAAAFAKPSLVLLGEWMSSATQHYAQWGYPDNCLMLGKDANHPQIYCPAEAMDRLWQLLAPGS